MLESGWLFVGIIALTTTAVAVSTKSKAAAFWGNDDGVAIFAGIVGFLAWGIWTYGTLNVEVATNSGVETFASSGLTYFGIAMALIPGYIALTGPADIIRRSRQPQTDDL